ncbi:MAG: hypothetical protein DRQ41_07190, partial [Gammaproteobacteria bacterium]
MPKEIKIVVIYYLYFELSSFRIFKGWATTRVCSLQILDNCSLRFLDSLYFYELPKSFIFLIEFIKVY